MSKRSDTDKSNFDRKTESAMRILKVLSDEKWHKYGELLEKTKLSSRTLTKRLDYFIECKLIKKEVREYPSAYYRAKPELVTWTDAYLNLEKFSKNIEPLLLEIKNPMFILNMINLSCNSILEITLMKLKEEKNTPSHKLQFLLDLFVWEPYKVLTWKLVETTKKHIDELPIKVYPMEDLLKKIEQLEKKINNLGE